MDFDENIRRFRETFWIVLIIALLINLIAGIILKIFEIYRPIDNIYTYIILILSLIIIIIAILNLMFELRRTTITKSDDIPVSLIYIMEKKYYALMYDYFPSKILWELKSMVENKFTYNSDLMDRENKFSNEIFQYIILSLLNQMHTHFSKTERVYKSKVTENYKEMFNRVNPFEINEFKSNPFVKNDENLQGTKVCFFKDAKLDFEKRTMIFQYKGIIFKFFFQVAGWTRGSPFEIRNVDNNKLIKYNCLISYELSVSPRAKISLFFFGSSTTIFYDWCKEVVERANNELDWKLFIDKTPRDSTYQG